MTNLKTLAPRLTAAALASLLALGAPSATFAEPVQAGARVLLPDFTALVEQNGKAVVNISSYRAARREQGARGGGIPGFDSQAEELLRRFGFPIIPFGDDPRGGSVTPEQRGTGSGFIIESDGLILTNAHVVEGADELTVRLPDHREFKGKVLGADKKTDVAVVKIEAKDLPTLKIGDSSKLKVGEWVAAIGSPFGLESSVTAGIVSATSRSLPSDQYVPFIQTDVAVNPGNSGGPLFNMQGEVVGINSQIYTRSGGYMGLSFAVPIDLAIQVKDQLVKTGKVSHGRIGVGIQSLTQDLADSFGLKSPNGALVTMVEEDSPAAQAGVQVGDVIVSYQGKKVHSSVELPALVASSAPGSKVEIGVLRDGSEKKLTVKVGELSDDGTTRSFGNGSDRIGDLGVTVRPLSPDEQKKAKTKGLVVEEASGPAERAGIRAGDILVTVNGKSVTNEKSLRSALSAGKKKVPVLVQRGEGRIYLVITMP